MKNYRDIESVFENILSKELDTISISLPIWVMKNNQAHEAIFTYKITKKDDFSAIEYPKTLYYCDDGKVISEDLKILLRNSKDLDNKLSRPLSPERHYDPSAYQEYVHTYNKIEDFENIPDEYFGELKSKFDAVVRDDCIKLLYSIVAPDFFKKLNDYPDQKL